MRKVFGNGLPFTTGHFTCGGPVSTNLFVNLLYTVAVLFAFAIGGYAYTNYKPGDSTYISMVSNMLPNTAITGNGFTKYTDQEVLNTNYRRQHPMLPASVAITYCQRKAISCQTAYEMWCVKGPNARELLKIPRGLDCFAIRAQDKSMEKYAEPFASVLPSKWREFRTFIGTNQAGNTIIVYINEENNRAYIAEHNLNPPRCNATISCGG